ncbi:MAG: ABC transporter substrate-binding protein [candidate division WOR-3 bacterium]
MTKLLNFIIVVLALALIAVILVPQIQENRPKPLRFVCDSSVTSLPFLIAVEETLFVKNRIIPQLSFYSDPDQALSDLFAGKSDIGIFPWSTVLRHIQEKQETLVVFMAEEFRPALPVDAIAKPKKSRIKLLVDLKGQRFAYPPQLRDYVKVLLATVNLKPEQVKLREVPFTALLGELQSGAADAVWLMEPQLCQLDFTKFDTIASPLTRYIYSPFPGAAIGFSPKFLANSSKVLRTRLKIALDAAVAFAETKPEQAKEILGRYFHCESASRAARLPELQRLVEINKPAVQGLTIRLLGAGILADSIPTAGLFIEPVKMTH